MSLFLFSCPIPYQLSISLLTLPYQYVYRLSEHLCLHLSIFNHSYAAILSNLVRMQRCLFDCLIADSALRHKAVRPDSDKALSFIRLSVSCSCSLLITAFPYAYITHCS